MMKKFENPEIAVEVLVTEETANTGTYTGSDTIGGGGAD